MKYITRKVIKGRIYHYLQYKNYSKNLGHFLPNDLKNKLLDFFINVSEKEYDHISDTIKNKFKFGSLEKLNKSHHIYIALKHSLFSKYYYDFFAKFIILFTYHSNRQEGSRVTKGEIESFISTGIRKPRTKTTQEIYNSFEAFNYAFSKDMKWNPKNIRHIHALLLDKTDPIIAGKWKTENNVAPDNQPTTDCKKVSQEMKELLKWLNSNFKNKDIYPPELALRFYCKFEKIHPFLDGNGRVGRILLNAILHKFNFPPVIFYTENQREHSSAIKQILIGRPNKMYKHYLLQVKKTNIVLINNILTH